MTNQIPSLEYTTISTDSYRFLKHLLFGSWESVYVAASERAYRDMCRTLRLEGVDGSKLRTAVDKLLETEIQSLLRKPPVTQHQYDTWHKRICTTIQQTYTNANATITVGQAQKWLNMTMKYLFVLDAPGMGDVFYFCHVPLDSYILEAAEKQLDLKKPRTPWSKIKDYRTYAEYQREIRYRLRNTAPLEWEFKTWLAAAEEKKGHSEGSGDNDECK